MRDAESINLHFLLSRDGVRKPLSIEDRCSIVTSYLPSVPLVHVLIPFEVTRHPSIVSLSSASLSQNLKISKRVQIYVPESSSMLQNFVQWLTGRKPELIDPTILASGSGRERKEIHNDVPR